MNIVYGVEFFDHVFRYDSAPELICIFETHCAAERAIEEFQQWRLKIGPTLEKVANDGPEREAFWSKLYEITKMAPYGFGETCWRFSECHSKYVDLSEFYEEDYDPSLSDIRYTIVPIKMYK